jgi:hypothetical protein
MVPIAFDFEGIAPVTYVLFALAMGIAVGTLVRRTIPAMAISLLSFLAIRFPVEYLLRPRYMAALTSSGSRSVVPAASGRGNWILGGGIENHAGHHLSVNETGQLYSAAQAAGLPKGGFDAYLQAHRYLYYTIYQPANRCWTFQVMEAALFLGLAALLLTFAVLWVRNRSTT